MSLRSAMGRWWSVLALAGLIWLAAFLLYAYPFFRPLLVQDDIQILTRSLTGRAAWDNLWVPANEHAMPVGRVTTWLLIELAGRPSALPHIAGAQGLLALMLGMGLLYVFIHRELGHPLFGLTAMALFGVSTVYQQAIHWFAASFMVLTLDTFLLALLAAQRWRQTGRGVYLGLCAAGCSLAPAWFASGALVGPLCCLYLLYPDPPALSPPRSRFRALALALAPLLGTLLFLAISLPRTARHIMHLEHYGKKTAFQSFDPLAGLLTSARSLVDNLVLGMFGVGGIELPVVGIVLAWVVLAGAAWWWWRGAADRRLLLLGLGTILSHYLLVYSARAAWGYEEVMTQPNWSRYHLFPHLGLVFFLCGGFRGRASWWRPDPASALTPRQVHGLVAGIALLFVVQLPRGLLVHWPHGSSPQVYWTLLREDPLRWPGKVWEDWRHDSRRDRQDAVLRRIEEMDARCREHRIAAGAARAVLDPLALPDFYSHENGWDFLRGSHDPLPHTEEEVRRLLLTEPDEASYLPLSGLRQILSGLKSSSSSLTFRISRS